MLAVAAAVNFAKNKIMSHPQLASQSRNTNILHSDGSAKDPRVESIIQVSCSYVIMLMQGLTVKIHLETVMLAGDKLVLTLPDKNVCRLG